MSRLPSRVRMEIHYDEGSVTMRIVDNGRRFDLEQPGRSLADHWGLIGMQERTHQICAQFQVYSRPGRGIEVEITVRLGTQPEAAA